MMVIETECLPLCFIPWNANKKIMIFDEMTLLLGSPAIILVAVILWTCISTRCKHTD